MKAHPVIVLVLNHADREKSTMQKIQTAIQRTRPDVKVQILAFRDPGFSRKLLAERPEVIMTFPFTALTTSYLFYIYKYLFNCAIVCFRREGILPLSSVEMVNGLVGIEKYGANLVDYEIFWGPKTAELVGNMLLEQKKLSSTNRIRHFGLPYFEDYFTPDHLQKKMLPDNIEKRLNQYSKDKKVLFITGFHLAEYSPQDLIRAGDRVELDNQSTRKALDAQLSLVQKVKQFRKMWIDAIIEIAIKNPDLLIIIKTHPLENVVYSQKNVNPYGLFDDYENILLITENVLFQAVISHCSVLFHYGSTTMIEAYLSHVPSFYVDSVELKNLHAFGIASALSADITNVASIVWQHAKTPIQFKRNQEVEKYIESQLNIVIGEPYNPSKRIAKLLLSLLQEAPQSIESGDGFLLHAVQRIGRGIFRDLATSGFSKLIHKELKQALKLFGDTATLIKIYARSYIHRDRKSPLFDKKCP
jgi:surface carbohydrate biosynthesis protein